MTERSILELLLRTKKQGTAAKDTAKEINQLKTASGEAGQAAEKLNLGMLAVKGAALSAGIAVLGQIGPLVDLGVKATRAETALVGLAGGGEAAAAALEAVKRGSGGAVDNLSAALNASRLFAMGLATNADEAEKLTRTAVTLGAAMGKGPQQSFEEFALLLANQSILRLDTFGISAGQVRERMAELAVEMPNATREARFLQATFEQAEVSMGKLNEAGFEATNSIDAFKAEMTNAKIAVGQFLADGLMPWIDGIKGVIDANREQDFWLNETSAGIEHQIGLLQEQRSSATGLQQAIIDTNIAQLEAKNATVEAAAAAAAEKDRWIAMGEAYAGVATNADAVAEANRNITLSLGELTQAKLASEAMEALNQQWKDGTLSTDDYKRVFEDVAENIGGMDQKAIDAQLALFDLNQTFADTGDLEGYIDGVEDLGQKIGALPSEKTITIKIKYEGGVQEDAQHGADFTVGGPAGVDKTPVFFMASRGERVKVTPTAGNLGGPQDSTPGVGGGGRDAPLIGTFNSYGGMDDRVFLEKFKSIARRQ